MRRALVALRKRVAVRPVLWILFGTLVFLYLNLFILPCIPIYLAEDPQIYLMNAVRMLEGQVIYRDFFQLTTPGTELVYVVLFKIFGVRAWIPNAVLVMLGLGFAGLGIEISRKVMSGPRLFLPSLLFLTCAFRIWFIGSTHSWFSVLAVMAAVLVVIEKRSPGRLAGAAALCGLASFFTQTRGFLAALGLAVFLIWEGTRQNHSWRALVQSQICLFAPFLATLSAVSAYFVHQAGLKKFLDSTILFPLQYFPADSMYNTIKVYMTDLPDLLSSGSWLTNRLPGLAMWFLIHALFPLLYVVFFMRYRRQARSHPLEPWDRLLLISIVGFSLFLGIAPSPSWFRLSSVSLPALIVLVWMVGSAGKFHRTVRTFLWGLALVLAVAEPVDRQCGWWAALDAPPGRMAVLDPDLYEKFVWLLHRTRPSDFFFRGIFPDYYFPLGLRNPSEVPYITATDYTRPAQVENVEEALEKHRVQLVLWSVWLDLPGDYHPEGDHLRPLRAYLRNHYHVIKIFADADYEQVWQRNKP